MNAPLTRARIPAPKRVPNLLLWLRADAGVNGQSTPADGDAVGTWKDQSGNGYHATQGTANAKPLWKAAVKNGLPAIRTDGTNDVLSGTLSYSGDTLTVFICAKEISAAGGSPGLFNMVAAAQANDYDNVGSFMTDQGSGVIRVLRNNVDTNEPTDPGAGAAYIFSVQWDGANETSELNGTATSPIAQSGTFAVATYNIAARWMASALTRFGNSDYYEIIAYTSSLSTGQRNFITNYLNQKWRIF